MLNPYQTGGGAYNTLTGGGASAQPVLKTNPSPRPSGPGGTVVVAPPDPSNPQAPPPGIDPSAVVRDHRAGHPTWRADAQQNMTDEDYAAWLAANNPLTNSPTLGVDASGAPVPNPNYVPPGAPVPAPPASAAPAPTDGPSGLYSLPGYQAYADQLGGYLNDLNGRTAPQAADSDFRAKQMELGGRLQRYADGTESLSRLQLQQATDAANKTQLAMAAGARPGQGALASRMASQNIGTANTALAGQAATAGLAERMNASNALQSLYNTGRSQDLANNQFNTTAAQNFQSQQDSQRNALLTALLNAGALQQHGGISEANNATQYAIAGMNRPGTGQQIAGSVAPLLPFVGSLLKGDGGGGDSGGWTSGGGFGDNADYTNFTPPVY